MKLNEAKNRLNVENKEFLAVCKAIGLETKAEYSEDEVGRLEAYLTAPAVLTEGSADKADEKDKSSEPNVIVDNKLQQGLLQTANLRMAGKRQLVNAGNRMLEDCFHDGEELGEQLIPAMRNAQVAGLVNAITKSISENNDFTVSEEMFPDIKLELNVPDLTPEAKKFLIAQTEAEALMLGAGAQ